MTRPDILALGDDALADLTNRGTLRRAHKELADPALQLVATLADDGTVEVVGSDDSRCLLLAGKAFADWECACLAGRECRHLVRAVVFCREHPEVLGAGTGGDGSDDAAGESVTDEDPTDAGAGDAPSPDDEPPRRVDDFDPATITDEQLEALPLRTLRAGRRLLGRGALGHVGTANGLVVVRIHHPNPVTVRFLAGDDLRYVRCTCTETDPCPHLLLAVALAKGTPYGDTGLRSVEGDAWSPDPVVIDEARALLLDLLVVGVEGGSRSLRPRWERLSTRARTAELHHLADVADELADEAARYVGRDARFDPSRLVGLAGELLARATSLAGGLPGRIPDRLVAGSMPEDTRVGRSRLIGMGTQLVESDDDVLLVAHLVDARSGAPLRTTRRVTDDTGRSGHSLAHGSVGGIPFDQWGGGQVLVAGGRRFGHGDFSTGNRRVTGLPHAALDQLPAPFLVSSVTELASHQSRLPAVLDDRAAGTALAACRFASVESVGFDPAASQLRAVLVDADGGRALLALARTPRTAAGLGTVADLLARWRDEPPADGLYVSGQWRWTHSGPVVDPLLLAAGDEQVQPHVAPPSQLVAEVLAPAVARDLTSPAALVHEVDALIGRTLVAGLDRLAADGFREWREFSARARAAGSTHVAELAGRVPTGGAPAVAALLLWAVFARPLA